MPKINTFRGVTMSSGTVGAYYPNNLDFACFIFQQMIDDGTKIDDDYTLTVFAVDIYSKVMNGGDPLTLGPLPDHSITAKKQVNFANMKLDLNDLKILYPTGVISDMKVYPTKYYKKTGYVVYTAETESGVTLATIKRPLNPSPPA